MYHFIRINDDGKPYLGFTDERIVEVGVPVSVKGRIKFCSNGLHASERIIDALSYVTTSRVALCEVELGGTIKHNDDKSVATTRTITRMLTVEQTDAMLSEFARWCASQVIHLWDAPDVVRRYLETGDKSLRASALAAARDAALDAARASALDAARASALDAARASALAAARASALDAAWDAAQTSAWAAVLDAAQAAQETKLRELFEAHF